MGAGAAPAPARLWLCVVIQPVGAIGSRQGSRFSTDGGNRAERDYRMRVITVRKRDAVKGFPEKIFQ